MKMKNKTLFCTVLEEDVQSTLKGVEEAFKHGADYIELRLDKLKKKEYIKEILQKTKRPVLAVCRPKHLDGFFEGTEDERRDWLLYALDFNPDMIDVEYTVSEKLKEAVIKKAKEKGIPYLIVYEHMTKTPSTSALKSILLEEQRRGAKIAKFAVMANSFEDTLRVLNVSLWAKETLNIPFVTIAMGKYGSISRPLACVFGGYGTYCCVSKDKIGAPGQLTLKQKRK